MQLNIRNQTALLADKRFIPLGKAAADNALLRNSALTRVIARYNPQADSDVWATLGWENDQPFTPEGNLVFSENGNISEGLHRTHTNPLTVREIADLKAVSPELSIDENSVRERFINFDDVSFTLPAVFNPVNLPRLRLTLFLRPDEGAIVYYQHSRRGMTEDPDAVVEYVLSDRMKAPDRDRLDYYFPVEPKHLLEEVDPENHLYRETSTDTGLSFIIKVLTFKQKAGTESQIYKRSLNEINKIARNREPGSLLYEMVGEDKYQLLRFDPSFDGRPLGNFVPVTAADQLDPDAKTLLLVHGTFVDTDTSYQSLLAARPTGRSYLQQLLDTGKFGQVLALNHPTISHNAEQNVKWLCEKLRSLGVKFTKPLQIITTSRGALVAEFMASDPEFHKYVPSISKIMMFSAGNGCGYFRLGDRISRVLGIWKNASAGPAGKIVSALAQLSVEWFLSQPGCVLMNENRPELGKILSRPPLNPAIRYKSVVSDWHKCLVTEEGWMKRAGNTSLDAIIRIALGKRHDWVIGLEQQKRIPVNSGAPNVTELHSVHGRYLELNYVRDTSCNIVKDPHAIIAEFFD
jgi:hypothetical protein